MNTYQITGPTFANGDGEPEQQEDFVDSDGYHLGGSSYDFYIKKGDGKEIIASFNSRDVYSVIKFEVPKDE